MRPLTIVWQRLVTTDGATCDLCGGTFAALQLAVAKLKDVLAPLDLAPRLETIEISEQAFKIDPLGSNQIWIAGKSLEEWLGAAVGSSTCCSVCGESNCRTVEIGGVVYESIPPELIARAALIAAAQMVGPSSEAPPREKDACSCQPSCCGDAPGS